MKQGKCPKCGSANIYSAEDLPLKSGPFGSNSIPISLTAMAALDNYVSHSVEILDVALLCLRFQPRCGLGLSHNPPFMNGHGSVRRSSQTPFGTQIKTFATKVIRCRFPFPAAASAAFAILA
ncbi:MAG: hypothetical protein HGJ93_12985 [Desulfosarcina sp.]|nr:hypothetical protein [Desulfosarcina sp.]MBC2766839.1 hypothetical protein [Desulfosarcina sp.]